MKTSIKIVFLILVVFLSLIGCSTEEDIEYDLIGKVVEINNNQVNNDIIGILFIENEDTKVNLTITKNTIITLNNKEMNFDEIKRDMIVEVKYDGPVAESYPLQAKAKRINFIE